ncbi:hypothetical protein CFP65_4520 [Kitasatospora sp. MMS16-BH015]|nr:hypothetical protein CFP65_4520 [Kitasatospora sp. MMS16-BH015]
MAAGERMARGLAGLDEAAVRGDSGLAGWSRGYAASHVVRSIDAYLWLLAWARDGVQPGPRATGAEIAAAVEAGAGGSGGELAAELRGRLATLEEAVAGMPAERWEFLVSALPGWRHPAWYTVNRCWREIETHHVDLAVGYRPADWSAAYVRWALDDTLAALAAREFPVGEVKATDLGRSWRVDGEGPVVGAPGHVLLAWLSGRGPGENGWPAPPTWPLPPSPGWG